jgi:hypothetical protein
MSFNPSLRDPMQYSFQSPIGMSQFDLPPQNEPSILMNTTTTTATIADIASERVLTNKSGAVIPSELEAPSNSQLACDIPLSKSGGGEIKVSATSSSRQCDNRISLMNEDQNYFHNRNEELSKLEKDYEKQSEDAIQQKRKQQFVIPYGPRGFSNVDTLRIMERDKMLIPIAKLVAGRLGYESWTILYHSRETENAEQARYKSLSIAESRALSLAYDALGNIQQNDPLAFDKMAIIFTRISEINRIKGMGEQSTGAGMWSSRKKQYTMIRGDNIRASNLFLANVDHASSIVAGVSGMNVSWMDIVTRGSDIVMSMFAELVAVCMTESMTRTDPTIHEGTKIAAVSVKKDELRSAFSTLRFDRIRGVFDMIIKKEDIFVTMGDPIEAALNLIGYM